MTDRTFQKPNRVEQARQRLDAALDRLETAMAANGGGAGAPHTPHPGPDPEQIAEMETLQAENARLRAANENVSSRLDATIGRLETLLGE